MKIWIEGSRGPGQGVIIIKTIRTENINTPISGLILHDKIFMFIVDSLGMAWSFLYEWYKNQMRSLYKRNIY